MAQSGVHEHLLNGWMANVGVGTTITVFSPSHTCAHTYLNEGLPMSITHMITFDSQRPPPPAPILQVKELRTREVKWLTQVITMKNNIWLHLPFIFTYTVNKFLLIFLVLCFWKYEPWRDVLWPYLSFHISRGWLLSFGHLNDTFLKPGAIAGWYRFLVLTPYQICQRWEVKVWPMTALSFTLFWRLTVKFEMLEVGCWRYY